MTTAVAAKPRHEPEEREDPANLMLDAFVDQVEAMKEMGYGPQLLARLERLFPPKPAVSAPSRTARIIADGDTALGKDPLGALAEVAADAHGLPKPALEAAVRRLLAQPHKLTVARQVPSEWPPAAGGQGSAASGRAA